jgi:RNA ligase (TIGR02306 family)
LVNVFGGYQCVVSLADWKVGDLAAYVPPDNVLPDKEEYAWLKGKLRVKACRLRGELSFGLLLPAPEGAEVGDDVADQLEITHYEPPIRGENGMGMGGMKTGYAVEGPAGFHPKYDVDALRRYKYVFEEGEPVFVSEKIDGTNFRACCVDGVIHVGSRNEWKEEAADNIYWNGLRNTSGLIEWLHQNPEFTVYGELIPCQVRGKVRMEYNTEWGKPRVVIYDILHNGRWLNAHEGRNLAFMRDWVPTIEWKMPFNFEKVCELAEGLTMVHGANHLREGVVVKPIIERTHRNVGRVNLKVVSAAFLEL